MEQPWKVIISMSGPEVTYEIVAVEGIAREDAPKMVIQALQSYLMQAFEDAEDPNVQDVLAKYSDAMAELAQLAQGEQPKGGPDV